MNLAKKIKNQKGTSLIELLVAVTLFSVIILSATSIFKSVIDGQRNSISAQNVQENIRYAMERMSKEIRMAKISNHNCEQLFFPQPTAANKVFNISGGNNDILYFKNKDDICVAYYLESNRLKIKILKISNGESFVDFITPSNTLVSNLKFYTVDDKIGAFHSVQPYVTMVMDIKAVGLAIHAQEMKVQMTVSSRYYE
jgi:prepilin-type N-terminal cleavage/methylation domain-containing protein